MITLNKNRKTVKFAKLDVGQPFVVDDDVVHIKIRSAAGKGNCLTISSKSINAFITTASDDIDVEPVNLEVTIVD